MKTLISLLAVALLALPLTAQPGTPCFLGPDGFDIGCCNIAQPNLPQIPATSSTGKHGCLLNCGLDAEQMVTISLGAVSHVTCDIALISVTVTPATPAGPAYSGLLVAKYARTWVEPGTFTNQRQVWRYLVNGDLLPVITTAVPGTPCPYPPIVGTPGLPPRPVHFFGSIDFTCSPQTPISPPGWRFRLDLTHAPGCIQHAPWTARPLPAALSHPDRSYHLVAPANFVFAPVPEPQGPILQHAIRRSVFGSAGYLCLSRARVLQGDLMTIQDDCLCAPSSVGPVGPWHHQNLVGVADCAGVAASFASLPVPGTPFTTGLIALSLGSWVPTSSMPSWPAPRELVVYHGLIDYIDPCSPALPLNIVHGVGTRGVPGQIIGMGTGTTPPISDTFIDLCNHLSLGTAFGAPTFGEPTWSDLVFSLNTP